MPNILPVDTRNAGSAQELVDAVQSKLGKVPNLLATLARSPASLEYYLQASAALDRGILGGQLREKIALTVASANECHYCMSAHKFIATNLGVDTFEAGRNLAGQSSNARTEAILQFVRAVVAGRGRIEDSAGELSHLRGHGVTDEEIVEIIANIALNLYTNYFNQIVDTEIDFPPVNGGNR